VEPSKPDFIYILKTLTDNNVNYIIVGGICAVLHGAPVATFDIDIVHSREPENVERLMKALEELEATYRDPAGRVIKPDKVHLSSPGHHLFMTKAGPLDLLGKLSPGKGYDELIQNAVTLRISESLEVHLLDLETLIKTKEEAGREKDLAVMAILRKTLEEKNKNTT
jgi:hypothetical protein